MARSAKFTHDQFKKIIHGLTAEDVTRALADLADGSVRPDFDQPRTRYIEDVLGGRHGLRPLISAAAMRVLKGEVLGKDQFWPEREGVCLRRLKTLGFTVVHNKPRVKGREGGYVPSGLDERKRTLREVVTRPGQGKFKSDLISRYGCACLVTGYSVEDVIEAAHINPYRDPNNDDHEENGLLLRADVHTLFDNNLLGIEPLTLTIQLHPEIAGDYAELQGKKLRCKQSRRPHFDALRLRFKLFNNRLLRKA